MKKAFFIILFCLSFQLVFSQTIDVLKLKEKRFFTEKDLFKNDSTFYILCEVCYNKPNVIDEEYCHSFSLTIINKTKFKAGTELDIDKDTSIARASYNRLSVWNWDEMKNMIKGKVKIISVTEELIKLELNVELKAKQNYIYKGYRTFKRSNLQF